MTDREWLLAIRQLLLSAVDIIERRLGLERTAQLRKALKRSALPTGELDGS
jgi:hypothetical protein